MPRFLDRILDAPVGARPLTFGVLEGEGVGPEVIAVTLRALRALEHAGCPHVEVHVAPAASRSLDELAPFCARALDGGGALLAGPYAGRFVYDLRRRFDLFCKVSPLLPSPALRPVSRVKPAFLESVDIVVVRENTGGIYQGRWEESGGPGERVASHSFSYDEGQVRRILAAGVRLAAKRRGRMAVIVKPGGVPSVSRLWCDVATEVARETGIDVAAVDVDHAAYRLVQHAQEIDVVVAPNLFGDILNDLGAVLLGSRGVSFSGNFSPAGGAVYQTNHGAAKDLAGSGRANPAGQLLSLAMLLRESLALEEAASLLEAALEETWRRGFRTFDVAQPNSTVVGTAEFGERVCEAIAALQARRSEPVLS